MERRSQKLSGHWLTRSRQGDFQAFSPVIQHYQRSLFAYIHKMVGNHHLAEDMVQETFIRAYRKLHLFEETRDLGSWLHRIAHNLTVDFLRREKRYESVDDMDTSPKVDDAGTTVLSSLEKQDEKLQLENALQQVAVREREVLLLHYFGEKSVKEIAYIVGSPMGTILAQLSRGRKKMKAFLKESDYALSK